MTQRTISVVIAMTCLVGVGAIAWWGFRQRTSPGPLHSSHSAIAELSGGAGCNSCHSATAGGTGGEFEATCVHCHTAIGDQLAHASGLHGKLDSRAAKVCEACHHEHLGDSVALVSDVAFRAAGVPDVATYNHSHVSNFMLSGAHTKLACARCHERADAGALAAGTRRYLGLSKECAACHDDAHKGELGAACAECHGQERPFKEAPLFKHPASLPLVDGHAGRACAECHTTPKVFTGLDKKCVSCHDDTYRATSKPAHDVAGIGTDCARCHDSASWERARFSHPERFALAGAHAPLECAACHKAGDAQARVVAFVAKPSCEACHTSPHDAGFVRAAHAERAEIADACVICHDAADLKWNQGTSKVTPALHAASGFPLELPHDKRACAECHAGVGDAKVARAEWKIAFPGRPADTCEGCHKDPHRSQFAMSASKGACLSCHAKTAFVPSNFDTTMHDACGFALQGSHRAVACVSCHKIESETRVFVGTTSRCSDCHQDVHAGKFDGEGMAKNVDGKEGCARCHDSVDFQRVAWTAADHAVWTRETLAGKHAQASCNACHRRPDGAGVVPARFIAAPTACADCHEDPHARQFEVNGVNDCARCHASTDSFKTVTFDHQKNSRFVPDEMHQKLACAACHRSVEIEGRSFVRYKPLGVLCGDCHDPLPRKRQEGALP